MSLRAICFDLNGTTLDTSALDPLFVRLFNDPLARERWFEQLQILWLSVNAIGTFVAFDKLAKAALKMRGEQAKLTIGDDDADALAEAMQRLPAYADVVPALKALRGQDIRITALTNGSLLSAKRQLQFAKLSEYFADVYSVESVKRYKPAPEPYRMVATELNLSPGKILMVAAHSWDLAGAHAAGMQTAFIARPRQVLNPLNSPPDHQLASLEQLVQIARR